MTQIVLAAGDVVEFLAKAPDAFLLFDALAHFVGTPAKEKPQAEAGDDQRGAPVGGGRSAVKDGCGLRIEGVVTHSLHDSILFGLVKSYRGVNALIGDRLTLFRLSRTIQYVVLAVAFSWAGIALGSGGC